MVLVSEYRLSPERNSAVFFDESMKDFCAPIKLQM